MTTTPDPGLRGEALSFLVQSDGWDALRDALRARLARIERRLALQRHAGIEEVRELQAEHRAYRALLEDPKGWALRQLGPAPPDEDEDEATGRARAGRRR